MINAVHGSFAGFSENFIYILTNGGVEYSIEISLLDLEEILSKSEEERKNLINRAIPSSDGEGQSYFSLRDTDNGSYFTLQVFSDEMRNIGLMKGDLALFLKTESAKSGDIVLASVSDGDGMMIRRLFIRPDGLFDLVPENDSMGRTTARCVIIHARLVMSTRRYSE